MPFPIAIRAHIDDAGHVRVTPRNRSRYRSELQAHRNTDVVMMLVPAPSIPLLRYYWCVVIRIVSEHTGYEPQEASDVLKATLRPDQADLSVGAMDTRELQDWIAEIQRFASAGHLRADHEPVYIPDPNEVVSL